MQTNGFSLPQASRWPIKTTGHNLQRFQGWLTDMMMKQPRVCHVILRSGVASLLAYLLIVAICEITWRLPLDMTEQWLTIFHFSAVAVVVALMWSLTANRMILMNGSLMALGTILPALLIIWVR